MLLLTPYYPSLHLSRKPVRALTLCLPDQPFLSPRNTTFEGSQPNGEGQEEVRRGGPIGTEAPVSPVYPPESPGQIWIWSPDIAAEAGPGLLAHVALFPCPVCLGQSCLSIPGKFITIDPSTIPVCSIILSINRILISCTVQECDSFFR